LLDRYGRVFVRNRKPGPEQWKPLPGQKKVVDELETIVRECSSQDQPQTIALEGRWGAGKSTALDFLERSLTHPDEKTTATDGGNPRREFVVVRLDVWRHASEPDLHLALFESLLPKLMVEPLSAFFRFPLLLSPVLVLRYMMRFLDRGQVEVSGFRAALTLPSMLWQRWLEHCVSQVRGRDKRTLVWILDEIDRCPAEMAQAAMTLTRRALNLPGCIVILPYVREQMLFKGV
ncbi:MAG: P-loop NTPase fold protein, partial [Candidatus Sumerlaeota bacterium]|nr:P-loop NTPase fold protein [Candidatus Sumerlaeota bacterium]